MRISRLGSVVSLLFAVLLFLVASPVNGWAQTAAHFSYAQMILGGGLSAPAGIAVDGNGNVFVADAGSNSVKQIPTGCLKAACVLTIGSGFSAPSGLALDASGNVYVADTGNNAVKKILAAGGYATVSTLGSGFKNPQGVAVDNNNNVYVADTGNSAVKQILASSSYATVNSLGGGFSTPAGIAVDGSSNVYVADTGSNTVKMMEAAASYSGVYPLGGGFNAPAGVAIDASGNLFVTDSGNNAVKELTAGCTSATCVQTLSSDLNTPVGLSVDGRDSLYIADKGNSRVLKQTFKSVDFGAISLGQSSGTISLVYTFDSGGTIGSPAALTLGVSGLDFAVAGTGTCSKGASYNAGATCTVDVTFTPKFAGMRYGAAALADGSGNTIASAYIHGNGLGPQASFLPPAQNKLSVGISLPFSVAVDGNGNLFVASDNSSLHEVPQGCASSTCVVTVDSGFNSPTGIAIDGGGNLFVGDTFNSEVKEVPLGCTTASCIRTLGNGFDLPGPIALDGDGNVFVLDGSVVKEVLAAGGYTTVRTLSGIFVNPQAIAVDSIGNVFIPDFDKNSVVWEIEAAGGYTVMKSIGSGFQYPQGIAIDGNNNIFVGDTTAIKELLAADGYSTVNTVAEVGTGNLAVDGGGDIFAVSNFGLVKLDVADAPTLAFASTTTVGTTDTYDGLETVAIRNNGNNTLTLSGLTLSSANFVVDSGTTTCTSSSSLAVNDSCTVGVRFAPAAPGSLTSSIIFVDNAMNVAGATQQVNLSGTAETAVPPPAPTITSGPANPTFDTAATFVFTDTQSGVTFLCSLDGAAFASCNSPASYSSLKASAHTFAVKAVDAANNMSAATIYNWSATAPPAPTIDAAPASPNIATTASFNFSDAQSGVTFMCSLDSASYSACTSGISYSSLATGVHTFSVEAKNSLGNLSLPTAYSWTISSLVPLGTGALADFGTIPVGQTSASLPLTYTFTGSVTLGSPVALTEGSPNLDFAIATGGTGACVQGTSYSATQSCTVFVTFTPKFAGSRKGALLLKDSSGNTVAMSYLHASGSAPQMRFLSGMRLGYAELSMPTSQTTIGGGFSSPYGIAVDGAGDLFLADYGNSAVKEIPVGCAAAGCVITLGGGFNYPRGVALDGAGNVFVADWGYGQIQEIPSGCTSATCVKVLGSGFNSPYAVAVDSFGNVFVADGGNQAVKEILAAGGYVTVNSLATGGWNWPEGVALDGNNNLFVVDDFKGSPCTLVCWNGDNASFSELRAANGYATVDTLATSFSTPFEVAADGVGNMYITAFLYFEATSEFLLTDGYVVEQNVQWGGGFATSGVAVDGTGNLYFANASAAVKLDYVSPPSLSFATETPVGSTDTVDGAQQFMIQNNGNTALNLSGMLLSSADFNLDPNTTTCSTSVVLYAGKSCVIGVLFTPITAGALTGTLTLTSNNLNASGASQQIGLSGVTPPPAPVISSGPANPSNTSTATFTFSDTQAGVTFLCGMDGNYSLCSSGVTYQGLLNGTHTFVVEAADSKGFASPETAYTWTLSLAPPPAPTITSSPTNPTAATAAAFIFSDTQTGVTFQCSLDGAAYGVCSSGISYSTLAQGAHTFTVQAKDSTGNLSTPATYSWTIGTVLAPAIGTAEDFGPVLIGQTSAKVSLTFTLTSAVTLGTPAALTMGATGLDFATATTGTCTAGASFSANSTCTVDVTFSPKFSGLRMGSLLLPDNAGNTIATVNLRGTGLGPQISFLPYTARTLGVGFVDAAGLALDGKGNLFVSDEIGGAIKEVPVGCNSTPCSKVVASTFMPMSVAVDGAGNLWYYPSFGMGITGLLASSDYTTATYRNGFNNMLYNGLPIAVDANGDVFALYTSVLEDVASTGVQRMSPAIFSGGGLAVDGSGNIFVAETAANAVLEIPGVDSNVGAIPLASGFNAPGGVAIDGNGNLFVADTGNNAVKEILAAGGYTTVLTIASGVTANSIALDASGNIYLSYGSVQKLDLADAPALTFATVTQPGATDTKDGAQTFTVRNNGNMTMSLTGIAMSSANFTLDSSSTTCTTSSVLSPNSSCVVGVLFTPTTSAAGTITGTVSLTDNALNATSSVQQISLTGVTPPAAPSIISTPANPTLVTSATFTFSDPQANVTFLCALEYGTYSGCSSGITYWSLSNGAHSFAVEAVDAAGNISAASTYSWTIGASALQVTVGTTPAGLSFSVDGTTYTSTQSLTWNIGDSHTIATTSPQTSGGTQNTFASWSDGGAMSHSVTASASTTSYTATFSTAYQLTTAASPTAGGTVTPAAGSYYASGTVVNLSAVPNSGYTFSSWTGNVANSASATTTVTMSAAQSVTANFSTSSPAVTLTPTVLSFGSQTDGTTSTAQNVVLKNSGSAPLTITAVAATGANAANFLESDNCVSSSPLAANATCTIAVQFAPTSPGSDTASVSITDNATGSPQGVTLSGTGTAPPAPIASLAPASLSFSAISGTSSASQTATLSNTGNAALTIGGITIGGANPGDFSETNNCGTSLAAGTSCSISVTFSPASVANFTATLAVADNAAGTPQTATLSGTGTAPDYSVNSSTPSQTVTTGGAATYNVNVQSIGSYNGSVTLSVTGLPTGATATFSPNPVTLGATSTDVPRRAAASNTSGTSILTVQTNSGARLAELRASWPFIAPVFGFLMMLPARRLRRQLILRFLVIFMIFGTAFAMVGCGGGFAIAPQAKTYTLTITGTNGAVTHSTTVLLTVK